MVANNGRFGWSYVGIGLGAQEGTGDDRCDRPADRDGPGVGEDAASRGAGRIKGKAYRSITRDVIKQIEKRLANIDWTIPDDEKKLAERKGKTSVKDG